MFGYLSDPLWGYLPDSTANIKAAILFLRKTDFFLQHPLSHSAWTKTRRYANLAQNDFANSHRRASPADNWRL